jgi:hypothetical protein
LILILSVLLRVGVAVYYGDQVPRMQDDCSYSRLAARLVGGHGYSFGQPWYPFSKPAGYPTAQWSFLYTAFVAAIYALFGVHPLAVRLVQAVLGGLLLPWMVYRLTRTLDRAPSATPLLAAALTALYAYFILYAARPMTETFYIVALLWSLEVSLRLERHVREGKRPPWPLAVQLGVSLGLAALLRQSILPWVPVLFAWLLWQAWRGLPDNVKRFNVQTFQPYATLRAGCLNPTLRSGQAVPTLFVAGVILLAFILPFTLRNYRVYGDFLLLNSNTGYAMYSAQHPMHGTRFQEHSAAPLPEDLRSANLDEPALDRELMRRGIQFILDEPGRYLLLSLSRVEDYFRFWPTSDSSLLYNVGRVLSFGLYLPFMLYGLYRAVRTPGFVAHNALILIFIPFYTALHIFTWAMIRYRLPVDAVLMPFAALALVEIGETLGLPLG